MAKPKSLPYDAPETEGPYSVNLHSTVGGSDKVYNLTIQEAAGGWLVNFSNGPRGGTLKTDTKTKAPIPYLEARETLNKVLYSKVGDGYLPIGGSRFADGMTADAIAVIAKESSGWLPQLLTPMADPSDEIGYYTYHDDWVAEEKHNGERRFVIVDDTGIRGGNRTGQTVALPAPLAAAAAELGRKLVIDGEQVGDRLYAFDVLSLDGESLVDKPLFERRQLLESLIGSHPNLRITEQFGDQASKLGLIENVKNRRGEGVVFKRLDAKYSVGKPSKDADWVKLKFWKALSAIVEKVNTKRSVAMMLIDDESGASISVGNVTIPPDRAVPSPADVIEVQYLYAHKGGSLFQPTYLGLRTDIRAEECLASQREFKADDTDPADEDDYQVEPGMGL